MVEEEKKPEEIKPEEPKQEEEKKKEEVGEESKPVENLEQSKDGQEESKGDEAAIAVADAVVVVDAVVAVPVAAPPPEILLKVLMHCEACARKVRRCLREFPGVEKVITDFKSHQVIVKGEKADPIKVLERVQSKSKSPVELLSPIPSPPEEKKPSDEEEKPNPPEKAEIISVVLKVFMHCENCAQGLKKRIQKMKGVETVEADLKNSEVSVKGVFDPANLVEFVYKKIGKQSVIVKQEPVPEPEAEKKETEGKEEEKKGEESEKKENKGEEKNEKKEVEGEAEAQEKKEGVMVVVAEETKVEEAEERKVEEVKIIEYYHNKEPERINMEMMYAYPDYYKVYPPQMFSDENPNACTIM